MSEIVITFQSERDLWYVQLGEATAVVSAEDMVHEYYRWRRVGAPGQWRDNAHEFCRRRVANPELKRSNLVQRRTTTCGTNCDR